MGSIITLVVKRLGLGLLTLFIISILIFLGVEALPGDLAQQILGQSATPETVAALRKQLHLDLPAWERYWNWLSGLLSGDLGNSVANNRPISDLISNRLDNTIFLAVVAAIVSVPLAVTLGVLAALYRDGLFDKMISAVTLSTISFPEFFVAYILIMVFAVQLEWFPAISAVSPEMGFFDKLYAVALPCMTLTLVVIAHMMRMTRAAIINVLSSPYIEMATLKGMSRRRVIVNHAFPNALSPIINVIILNLAYLIVGVVVVEVVFVYPGLGQLMVDSVSKRDLPVVQACAIMFACAYILMNLLADVLAIVSNPRLLHPK